MRNNHTKQMILFGAFFFFVSSFSFPVFGVSAEPKALQAPSIEEDVAALLTESGSFDQKQFRPDLLSESGQKAIQRIAVFVGRNGKSSGLALTKLESGIKQSFSRELETGILLELSQIIRNYALSRISQEDASEAIDILLGVFTLGADAAKTDSMVSWHIGCKIQCECCLEPLIEIQKDFPKAKGLKSARLFFSDRQEELPKEALILAALKEFEKNIDAWKSDPGEIGEHVKITYDIASGRYLFEMAKPNCALSENDRALWADFQKTPQYKEMVNKARAEFRKNLIFCRLPAPYPQFLQIPRRSQNTPFNPFIVLCVPDFTRIFFWETKRSELLANLAAIFQTQD